MDNELLDSNPAIELDNDIELKQKIKNKANELGVLVEYNMLEDLPNIKKLLASLAAGVALNSMILGNAEGASGCYLPQDYDVPQLHCDVDINNISQYIDNLPTEALDALKQFTKENGLIHVQFTKGLGENEWTWNIDSPDNFNGEVDGSQGHELYEIYRSMAKIEDEDGSIPASPYSGFEESFITTYTKCITESVENGSFDANNLHDSFLKLFNA